MEKFNLFGIIKTLLDKKWYLVAVGVISFVAAAIFSSEKFITPLYESEAIVYPSDLSPRSDENETEQMLQWLTSRDIKDSLIRKYNLTKRYNIDTTVKGYYQILIKEFNKHVSISRNQYEAVIINVEDKDADTAYLLVNDVLNEYDSLVNNEFRKKYKRLMDLKKKFMDEKMKDFRNAEEHFRTLNIEYNLIHYDFQAEQVTKGFLGTVENLNRSALNKTEILKTKKNLENKGTNFIYYHSKLYNYLREFNKLEVEYEKIKQEYEKEISYYYMVESPHRAEVESYPKRSVIVFFVLIASLLFTSFVIIALDEWKKHNAKHRNE
jgi:capsular polysaccharide biosynthesis protein